MVPNGPVRVWIRLVRTASVSPYAGPGIQPVSRMVSVPVEPSAYVASAGTDTSPVSPAPSTCGRRRAGPEARRGRD
ncbi:hypothetical protein, partial [Streptomyces sp. WAC05858]|uniref:hypothetical protein n=1 Tax=Streptomyces sp. WAC05858 TaxID=2487409 RepID=UPI0021AFEF43